MSTKLTPCSTCGLHLAGPVHDAGNLLYGGSMRLTGSNLAHGLEQLIAARPNTSDTYNVSDAIVRWFDGVTHTDLAAAVRHWGDLGHLDGSECERLQRARADTSSSAPLDRPYFDQPSGRPPGVPIPKTQE